MTGGGGGGTSQKLTRSPPIRVPAPSFYILPMTALLSPLLLEMGHESLKTKTGYKKLQLKNESIFLGYLEHFLPVVYIFIKTYTS